MKTIGNIPAEAQQMNVIDHQTLSEESPDIGAPASLESLEVPYLNIDFETTYVATEAALAAHLQLTRNLVEVLCHIQQIADWTTEPVNITRPLQTHKLLVKHQQAMRQVTTTAIEEAQLILANAVKQREHSLKKENIQRIFLSEKQRCLPLMEII